MTVAEKILFFLSNVTYEGVLPDDIRILNPYKEDPDIRAICRAFYEKYYDDNAPRDLMLGINPGRLGAGATGIPFTDTKRLYVHCGIRCDKFSTHEPSSVFMYEMIEAYGGVKNFYKRFYISSLFPLGIIKIIEGKSINYNYYDSKLLEEALRDFIIKNIETQIKIAGKADRCYCLGSGKNYQYLEKINREYHFFKEIIPLEHPRYIMQYKSKVKADYLKDYFTKFQE